jgi:hypothetical protein
VKEYKFGNSTVIVHSAIWSMSEEEQTDWVKKETEKGNATLKRIREAIKDCYRNHD